MRFLRVVALSLCGWFLSFSAVSQQLNWALKAGGTATDISTTVAKDNAGNVYIAGKFSGTNVDFDPSAAVFPLSSAGGTDCFVAKYNAAGQFQWAFRFGGANLDEVHGIAFDQNDNFFITGYFRGINIDFDPGAGVANVSSNGDAGADPGYGGDIFIAKYTSNGVYQWAFNIGGTDLYDAGIGISTDAAGNVYAGGYFTHTADFDPGPGSAILNSAVTGSIFLAKYSNTGAYQWAFGLGSPLTNNSLFDIKTDAPGNVYITGYYQGTNIDFDPGAGVAPLNALGGYEVFVAKYNANGQYQFAFSVGGTGWDVARGIGLDAGGNIYVIGDYNNTVDFDPGPGTAFRTSNGQGDAFLAKYSPAGQYLWAFGFGGTPNEYGSKVIIDNGHVFITGSFTGTADLDPSAGIENLTSAGGYDIYLGKYTLNGEYLCSFSIGGPANDGGHALVSAAPNVFYLTGYFSGTNIDFDPAAATVNLSSAGAEDIFLAKYTWPDNVPPAGALAGDVICTGEQAQLTFTATNGTGPFTVTYNNGTTDIVQTNVQSGVPFNISPNPTVTTTYTLVGIRDALRCSETNPGSGSTVVTVNNCTSVVPDFTIPATVCVGEPVTINNTSQGATSYFWNFCQGSINQAPIGTNLGNIGGQLATPVFMDYVFDNGNYYGFLINYNAGTLVRLEFGNSLLNTPTSFNLGNLGVIPALAEGIQVVKNEGKWYAIIVGGFPPTNTPRIVKVDFGATITNNTPVATNWGNIGTMLQPVDLHVFQENGNWYGFTVNAENNTITRFNFTNSFDNTPTAVNLGNVGSLAYPVGIYAINDNNSWKVFIVNGGNNSRTGGVWSLTRLDFGSSLLNVPTGVNLGNPGGFLKHSRDLTIMKFCDEIIGFAVNGAIGANDIVKIDFNNDLTSVPVLSSLGNIGNLDFPHSIAKIFRVGPDLYSFITNVANNTMTRLRFSGCTNSSIPNSTLQNPPIITYNTPGTYSINLTVDDGLPTQATVCKQIVVQNCQQNPVVINDYTEVLAFDICKNTLTVADASQFNVGDTVMMIQMKGAVIDSTNTAAFGDITDLKNAGNYEFNYIKSKTGNILELQNVMLKQYDIPDGQVQLVRVPYFQDYSTTAPLTCLPWNGSIGGVLAFNVQNTLQLNADINVNGKGFRGGAPVRHAEHYCDIDSFYLANNNGINGNMKGEGIYRTTGRISGRGKLANGGGGGNSSNAGGAGGGNAGIGGEGGKQYPGSCNPNFPNGGVGGLGLNYSNAANRIFLGGGGGAGHEDDTPLGGGGNGGGIVVITANTIITNTYSIHANGNAPDHLTGTNDDGRSGGGAGGAVLVSCNSIAGDLNINARGGKGDDCIAPPIQNLHGPGGGGGGGTVWINQPAIAPNLLINVNGGISGVNLNQGNNPWGATAGAAGQAIPGLVLPVTSVPFKPNIDSVRIRATRLSCNGYDFEGLAYVNNAPITTWQWSFGDGNFASTQNASHTYTGAGGYTVKLVATDANGCKDSISIDVETSTISIDFEYAQDACNPLTVQFTGLGTIGVPATTYYWSFGDNTSAAGSSSSHTYGAFGDYVVAFAATDAFCTDTIRKTINVNVIRENIILTNDTTICLDATKQLLSLPSLDVCWTPTTWLDNPNSPNPVTSTPETITYYLTAQVTGANLIANGDFSQGNTGFTSEYQYKPPPNLTEGQYYIGTNPQVWNGGLNNCIDHTGSNGNMMLVNGSPVADANVWRQTVAVVPNTNYAFSTWIQALGNPNPAQLQFSINGKNLGSLISASLPPCTWTQFFTTWNSGSSTSAVISIVNMNLIASGNDFALDDISFAQVYIKRDSVIITVDSPMVRTNDDITICKGDSLQLNTIGAQNYVWTPGPGLTSTTIANPKASPVVSTEYIVTGTNANGCVAKDTVNVNLHPVAAITKADNAVICRNTSVQIWASGGDSYVWSPSTTLDDPNIPDPTATPVVNTMYYVTITDANSCDYLDSVKVDIHPDPVFAINAPDDICRKDTMQLLASGGDMYAWQPVDGLNNPDIADPKASPAATTNYTVTITESVCNNSATLSTTITVNPLPDVQATRSNDLDCTTSSSQLNATGAGRYLWTPAGSLNNPRIPNPVATPFAETEYVVTGTNALGCTNTDTVVVKMTDLNKGDYLIPNAFTPNGDGLNDCFGIKYWGVVYEIELSIFNRWGQRLFYTKDRNGCWDGTFKGVKQDPNVFVYMIKAKTNCEQLVFRKGTFALIR